MVMNGICYLKKWQVELLNYALLAILRVSRRLSKLHMVGAGKVLAGTVEEGVGGDSMLTNSALSGVKVIEPKTVLLCVGQGATFRQIKGVRLLTMER